MNIHVPARIQNHIHFALAQQNPQTKILFTKKTSVIIKMLAEIGCIHRYVILTSSNRISTNYFIWLSVFFYKNTPFFKSFRLISTPSKRYTVSYKALTLLSVSLGSSVIVLSTSKGLITHKQALKKKIGGLLLYILS